MQRTRCPTPATLVTFASAEPMVPGTQQRLETHLAGCRLCRKRVRVLRQVLQRDLVVEMAEAYRGVASIEVLLSAPSSRVR